MKLPVASNADIVKSSNMGRGSPTKIVSTMPADVNIDASTNTQKRKSSSMVKRMSYGAPRLMGKSERSHRDGSSSKKQSSGTEEEMEVIKGPLLEQMALHFIWHAIFLILGNASGIETLFYYDLPLYVGTAYAVWQISRYIFTKDPISVIPLYLSFLAYIPFDLIARDGHMIFSGLWFASIMGIVLQMSKPNLEYHVVGISACFLAIYLAISYGAYSAIMAPWVMLKSLNLPVSTYDETVSCISGSGSTCVCPYLYDVSDDGTNCIWILNFIIETAQEVTFSISILLICLSSFVLQRHVREYAFSLLNWQQAVMSLSSQNANLQEQLKEMRTDVNLDLDSPITKVIKVIRDIQANGDLEADVMESLDYVIVLLSSNQLFMPKLNVNKDAMDTDVNKWLNAMITNQETQKPKSESMSNLLSNNSMNNVLSSEMLNRNVGYGTNQANIIEVLENVDTWEFDIFELARVTGGRPLYHLGMALFEIYNFRATFNVEESVMRAFLQKTEASYRQNPYHNSTHAADVMHAMHYFLTVLGLNELVTSEDAFSGIIAASIHDVDHPGFNNAFMIATASPAAIRYNDISVLEHHHASKGFDIILNEPGCNILAGVKDQYKTLRSAIVSMVLATDMTAHFEYITKFKNKMNGAGLEFTDPKDRQLCMDIAIKCGDVNNAAKSLSLCTQWANNIMEEFFKQGDEERSRGLPISMFMDRQTTVMSKCQMGFIDYIVMPLYEVWDQYMNDDGRFPAISNLKSNREHWKKQQDELQQQAQPAQQ